QSGLQFVCESDMTVMSTDNLPENSRNWLDTLPDRTLREQYLDFIHWRGFRKTLLCRSGHHVDLQVTPQRIERLMVASAIIPVQPIADLHADEQVEFRTAMGRTISCREA